MTSVDEYLLASHLAKPNPAQLNGNDSANFLLADSRFTAVRHVLRRLVAPRVASIRHVVVVPSQSKTGSEDSHAFQAWACALNEHEYLVVISLSLLRILFHAVYTLAYRNAQLWTQETPDFEAMQRQALPNEERVVSPSELTATTLCYRFMVDFVLAHECAHIVRGHIDHLRMANKTEVALYEDATCHNDAASLRNAMELDADRLAVPVSLRLLKNDGPVAHGVLASPYRVAGVGVSVLCRVFELIRRRNPDAAVSPIATGTHPRPDLRAVMCQAWLPEKHDDAQRLSNREQYEMGTTSAFFAIKSTMPELGDYRDVAGTDRFALRWFTIGDIVENSALAERLFGKFDSNQI